MQSPEGSARTVAFWLLERCTALRDERDCAIAKVAMLERDTDALVRRIEELEYAQSLAKVQCMWDHTPPAIPPVDRNEF
jgi:hypothetical protein